MKMRPIARLLVASFTTIVNAHAQKTTKPNIVVLYADDISARELPIYNSTVWTGSNGKNTSDVKQRAKTPILSHMAKEGIFVTTTWAATVCSPSRAMMMTGRYAHLHKWWTNRDLGTYIDEKGKNRVWPLYASSKTIGHIAKEGGYATLWTGKSQMKGADLSKFGFDEGVFTPGGQPNMKDENPFTDFEVEMVKSKKGQKKVKKLFNKDDGKELTYKYYPSKSWLWKPYVLLMNAPNSTKKFEWWPNTNTSKKDYSINTYGPDVELDFALDFIERKHKENEPFFIYHTSHLGHDAFDFLNPTVHSHWPGTPKISWDGKKYTRTEPNITGKNGKYDTNGTITSNGINYHINYLDYQVSKYLNKFKKLGIENNTIFIFAADNGTSKYGKHSPISQRGTHVPFIIYAPGFNFTKKGEQDILVNISDVFPTIADIAGVKIPTNYEINGESLWPYLTTDKKDHRDWIYAHRGPMQLIRGKHVLKDGKGTWWDVSKHQSDLISFPTIDKWSESSARAKKEKKNFKRILPKFNVENNGHDAPN